MQPPDRVRIRKAVSLMGIGSKEKVLHKNNGQSNASGEGNDSGRWRTFLKKQAKIFAFNLAKIAFLLVFFYLIRNYLD